jgi:hypothetical protein
MRRKGVAACSSRVRACSGDAPSVKADVGAVCKDAATPRSDTAQAPQPSPLITDHERGYAAPEPDRDARGACRRAHDAPGTNEPRVSGIGYRVSGIGYGYGYGYRVRREWESTGRPGCA